MNYIHTLHRQQQQQEEEKNHVKIIPKRSIIKIQRNSIAATIVVVGKINTSATHAMDVDVVFLSSVLSFVPSDFRFCCSKQNMQFLVPFILLPTSVCCLLCRFFQQIKHPKFYSLSFCICISLPFDARFRFRLFPFFRCCCCSEALVKYFLIISKYTIYVHHGNLHFKIGRPKVASIEIHLN